MDKQELEAYELQLSQIKVSLEKDPDNTEFLDLKSELEDLISLTREYLGMNKAPGPSTASKKTETTATPKKPEHIFKEGDYCTAKYSVDGKFYPAKVTSVGGTAEKRVYSVIFHGYSSTETIQAEDIKPVNETRKRQLMEEDETEKQKMRKKKKQEKKDETKILKTKEQKDRQQSWQKFAKKATSKGVAIPGVKGQSMFKSPEDGNPNAKVGVVGSGKGMTKVSERKRQTYDVLG